MPGQPHGIPEVPPMRDITLRRFLQEMRNAVKRLEASVVAPGTVSNLVATAKAGGVIIQFTRADGDAYILYWNSTPALDGARRIDLGLAAEYTDEIGAPDITRYYWVKTKKGQMENVPFGPVKAVTLALDASITPPTPPPGSQFPARSDETGQVEPGRPTGSFYERV